MWQFQPLLPASAQQQGSTASIQADAGLFTLAGQDVTFRATGTLTAEAGLFTLVGLSVDIIDPDAPAAPGAGLQSVGLGISIGVGI